MKEAVCLVLVLISDWEKIVERWEWGKTPWFCNPQNKSMEVKDEDKLQWRIMELTFRLEDKEEDMSVE